LTAEDQDTKSNAMQEVQVLVQQSLQLAKRVRDALAKLKFQNTDFNANQRENSTKAVWRNNHLRTLNRSVKEATHNVQTCSDHFYAAVAKHSVRNYCIVTEVSEEERTRIEIRAEKDPYGMQAEIMQKLQSYGVSDATIDKIQAREKQNKEMQKIETAVRNLKQMFEEMSSMVYDQGFVLDEIAANVELTRNHVCEARQEIDMAEIYQESVRKKKLCIAIICIIILVLLIVFATQE